MIRGTSIGPHREMQNMKNAAQKNILFITGAFVGNNCWDAWQTYFASQGYKTIAPPWPHKSGTAEDLRNSHPNAEIASNDLASLTAYFSNIAAQLSGETILIGHSIGGLIVQLLLHKGIGSAGVAIHSVPPRGILTFKPSFLRAGWKALGFFTSLKTSYLISFETWRYGFVNGMGYEVQKDTYYRYAIPESKRVVRDTLSSAASIDFSQPHPPLLLIAGDEDHSIPASLNYKNYKKYDPDKGMVGFKKFSGTNHFILVHPGWKEVANYIIHWLNAPQGKAEL